MRCMYPMGWERQSLGMQKNAFLVLSVYKRLFLNSVLSIFITFITYLLVHVYKFKISVQIFGAHIKKHNQNIWKSLL